jgi:hypothetical protein
MGKDQQAKEEASNALELSPEDPVMMYNAACFYSRARDVETALAMLKKAISFGFEHYEWLKRDPDLENIRKIPGYLEIIN